MIVVVLVRFVLDRWSSYTVMFIWEFALAGSVFVVLDEQLSYRRDVRKGLNVLWKGSENFYWFSQWFFLVQITYKSKFQWKVKSELAMYISYNFYYTSFPLWSIFSPPVDVQLKQLNTLCWAYSQLIFLRAIFWEIQAK